MNVIDLQPTRILEDEQLDAFMRHANERLTIAEKELYEVNDEYLAMDSKEEEE